MICRRALADLDFMSVDDLRPRAKGKFEAKYERGRKLAEGVGGVAYVATQKSSGTKVVVKAPKRASDLEDFEKLKDKFHPYIVRVFELFTSERQTHVVMEFCGGGDLFGAVEYCFEKFGGLNYKFVASVMKQTMQGTNYLAKAFEQCHNDLKPENVLLERRPLSPDDLPRCMIGDFGCVGRKGEVIDGDPRYRAPELWQFNEKEPPRAKPSFASDVWSLGVMLFELLSGGNLVFISHRNLSSFKAFLNFENHRLLRKLYKAIQVHGVQPRWEEIQSAGDLAIGLCRGMLAYESKDRPDLAVAMRHPYFDVLESEARPLPANLVNLLEKRTQLSTLKIAMLNFVASKLQGAYLHRYAEMWEKFDADLVGGVTCEAFMKILTTELGFSEAKATDLFRLADTGSKETSMDVARLDFNEFVALMFDAESFADGELELFLKGVFDDIAPDDGRLYFKSFVSMFPNSMSRPALQTLFKEMDQFDSGYVTSSDFQKFVESM